MLAAKEPPAFRRGPATNHRIRQGRTMMTRKTAIRLCLATTLAALTALPMAAPASAQSKTLRVAMHADVRTLDPFWTTQTIASIHGMMVYDTLFSSDSEMKPQPQMVEKWTVGEDRKVYEFTLRDGLKFHDGTPVTSKDVVASMHRWGKRDGAGKQLFEYTASLVPKDDKTFVWTLKEPYGLLIDTLAKTGSSVPFVMREKEAMVDPFQQITEVVGSGPFTFKRDEWVPGSKTVYQKFADYVPRKEPASGHAGGKVVKVDRVEFIWLADPQTAQSALVAGEIDYLENPQIDFLPILESTPGIKVEAHPAMGTMGILQLNHLHPPFNNVKARQAMHYIINNADFLNTLAADKKLQKLCFSFFGCDVAMETDAGSEAYKGPKDYKKAEALFKEAQGGWNIFITTTTVLNSSSPITHTSIGMACDKAWFGWPCDAKFEELRKEWAFAPDVATRKKVAVEISKRGYEQVPYISFAQWSNPVAYRADRLSGVLPVPSVPPMWNIEKK
jgi:peptide/nickel transport system substrate-binding protein